MSSTGSSSITSPDCIEHNITDGLDVAPTLEPVARFLEHAQQIQMQYQSNSNVTEKTTMERFKRVLSQLARLKESVGCSALSLIKQTVEVETETSGTSKSFLFI